MLENVTVDGAKDIFGTSAMIYNQGTLTVGSGAVLQNNNASGYGGAIYNHGGTLTVRGTAQIKNNSASYGGAIDNRTYGVVTITGGTLSGNSTNYRGGAINVQGATLDITGGTISGNSSLSGGGLYITASQSIVTITGGTISGNTASAQGGGINQEGGTLKISGSAAITGNTAAGIGTSLADGGGIYAASAAVLEMSGGTAVVSGNTARGNGGGVYTASSGSNVHTISAVIKGNTASSTGIGGGLGGGIYNSGALILAGGAVGAKGAANTADTGGGIYNAGTLTLADGTVAYNSATGDGGGLHNAGGGTLTITGAGTAIQTNSARLGGGLYVAGTSRATLSGGAIKTNTAVSGAGIYNAGTLEISGGAVSGNTATANGGGFYHGGGSLTFTGGSVLDNNAVLGADGYLAAVSGSSGHLFLADSPVLGAAGKLPGLWLANGSHITVAGALGAGARINLEYRSYIDKDPVEDPVAVAGTGYTLTPEDAGAFRNASEQALALSTEGTLVPRPTTLCLLSYDAGGGTGAPPTTQHTSNAKINVNATQPTRAGYSFAGWNTARDGTGDYYLPGASFTITGALTLYARWLPNRYFITYVLGVDNAPAGSENNPGDYTCGTGFPLQDPLVNQAGCRFDGWYLDGRQVTAITATDTGDKTLTARWTARGSEHVAASGISLDRAEETMQPGWTENLIATVAPANATDKAVVWASDRPEVATVDQSGAVTAVAEGTAVVTAATRDGALSAGCVVTVGSLDAAPRFEQDGQLLPGLSLVEQAQLDLGSLLKLVSPYDTAVQSWRSSSTKVAAVDHDIGLLTAKAAGTAEITVAFGEGDGAAECRIAVKVLPKKYALTGLTLNKKTAGLKTGATVRLTAKPAPAAAPLYAVTWSVEDNTPQAGTPADTAVLEVDTGGLVRALAPGSATVVATGQDYTGAEVVRAECPITVTQPVEGVTITGQAPSPLRLVAGHTANLHAEVLPHNATDSTVTWSSSNKKLVTVDSQGTLTAAANKTGTATVTASAGGKKATFKVTVVYQVASIDLAFKDKAAHNEIALGKTRALVPVFNAGGGKAPTNTALTWTVYSWTPENGNTGEVATVDAKGVVTAKGCGTARITATAQDNGTTGFIEVKVTAPVTKLAVTRGDFKMPLLREGVAATVQLGASLNGGGIVSPGCAGLEWGSSNTAVATVDAQTGLVTAIGKGSATITATAANGSFAPVSAKVKITVTDGAWTPVTSFKAGNSVPGGVLAVGGAFAPKITVGGKAASDKSVTWSLWDSAGNPLPEGIVQLDAATGKVTGLKTTRIANSSAFAAVTLRATLLDADTTLPAGQSPALDFTFTVVQRAESILLPTVTGFPAGQSVTLTATVLPADTDDAAMQWSSSKPAVASVDATGKVTAHKAGKAVITAKSTDGSGTKASCAFTVTQPVSSMSFSAKQLGTVEKTVAIGKSVTLKPAFNLGGAAPSNRAVRWESGDVGIATVSSKGKVTGKANGIVMVRAVSVDNPGVWAECRVTVNVPVKALRLDQDLNLSLVPGQSLELSAITTPLLGEVSPAERNFTWTSSAKDALAIETQGGQAFSFGVATPESAVCVTAGPLPPDKTSVKTTLTVKSRSGKTAKVVITITENTPAAAGVRVSKSAAWLAVGKSETLKPVFSPTIPGNPNVVWEVVSEAAAGKTAANTAFGSVLVIDHKGKMTAKGTGTATVRLTTRDGAHIATCRVHCVSKG